MSQRVMTPPGTDNPAPKDTTLSESNLQADIDSLLKDVAKSTERIENGLGKMPGVGAPLESDPETAKLAEAVNGLLGDRSSAGAAPKPEALAAIENLDAQLAELTAQLLDNNRPPPAPVISDVEAAQAIVDQGPPQQHAGTPVAQEAPAKAAPTHVSPPETRVPTPAMPAEGVQPPPVVPVSSAVVESIPPTVQTVAPIASVGPAPAVAAPSVPHASGPAPAAATTGVVPAPLAATPTEAVTNAESAALAEPVASAPEPSKLLVLMAAMSKPLEGKPKSARLVVGLIGIQSIILGLLVWAFVILRPPPKVTESKPYDLNADVLPRPVEPKAEEKPAAKGGHEASEGGHGGPAKGKTTPKKDASKKDAPKKAAHGEAKGH